MFRQASKFRVSVNGELSVETKEEGGDAVDGQS